MNAVLLRGSIAMVIVLLPFGGVDVPGLGISVVLVAMLLPATFAVVAILHGGLNPRPSILLTGLLLCVLSAMLSAPGSADPDASVTLVVVGVLALGYATAIVLAESDVPEVGGWLPLVVPVGGVVSAWALATAGSFTVAEGGSVVIGRLQGPFSQPNELGAFCAAMLPIAVIAVVTSSTRLGFAIQLGATIAIGAAWVMSMSRGAWIGGLAGLVIVAVFAPTTRRWLALAVGSAAAFVGAALTAPPSAGTLGVLGARLRSFSEVSDDPYDERPAIWAEAWRQAGDHPLLGVGPGGFPAASADSSSAVSFEPPLHPHNLLLTVLTERGLVGLLAASVVVLGCAVLMARAWEWYARGLGLDSAWRIAAVAGLVAIAGHGLVDMPLRNPMVAALTWTLLGYAAVSETGTRSDGPSPSARPRPVTTTGRRSTWRYEPR